MEKLREFWNYKSGEERRKIVVYSIASVTAVLLLGGVYFINNGERIQQVDEISNPDAKEAQRYNSRTEANQLARKDSSGLNTALDNLFGSSGPTSKTEDDQVTADAVGYTEPVYTEPNYSRSAPSYGAENSYNSHSTYGDYSMWQTEEPKNNSIGYTEIRNVPTKSSSPLRNKKEMMDYAEPVYSFPESTIKAEQGIANGKQIRAKLLSKGYFQPGRTLSFVLLEPTEISGIKAPKGQIVTGVAMEQNNRLTVNFSTIKIKNKIIPAKLKLFGSDGMSGLPIAGGSQDTGMDVESRILSESSRIPVVGGIVGNISGVVGKQPDNRILLTSNTECIIVNYN